MLHVIAISLPPLIVTAYVNVSALAVVVSPIAIIILLGGNICNRAFIGKVYNLLSSNKNNLRLPDG